MSCTNVRAELVAQEPVDLPAVVAVGGVDRGEGVPVDAVALERPRARAPPGRRWACRPCRRGRRRASRAVRRSRRRRGSRSPQERAPLVVEQRRVGLQGVEDPLPRRGERSSSSSVRRKKSRPMRVGSPPWNATTTSSAPRWAARSWLMYASCTRGVHTELAARVELVLGEEEAVLAVQVADGAGGLGHDVEGRGAVRLNAAGPCGRPGGRRCRDRQRSQQSPGSAGRSWSRLLRSGARD